MTRILPWLKRSCTATPRAERSPTKVALRAKRRKVLEPSFDVDDENEDAAGRGRAPNDRCECHHSEEMSSQLKMTQKASPPPNLAPPSERLMDEGLDKDDRFRMVEDEFLDAAKQFTQHFHAAEYQRLKRAAKAQNAAAIKSISRPVTIQMPDDTRRKVDSVARAKKQAATVQSILGKQGHGSESEEESDGNGGAWLGTALHGLMEDPRRSAASLSKVRKITVSARSARGFNGPSPRNSYKRSIRSSPQLEPFELPRKRIKLQNPILGEYLEESDDLDAPAGLRVQLRPDEAKKVAVRPSSKISQRDSKCSLSKSNTSVTDKESPPAVLEDGIETFSRVSMSARERIAKRLEQTKRRQIQEERESKELKIIPMFLS